MIKEQEAKKMRSLIRRPRGGVEAAKESKEWSLSLIVLPGKDIDHPVSALMMLKLWAPSLRGVLAVQIMQELWPSQSMKGKIEMEKDKIQEKEEERMEKDTEEDKEKEQVQPSRGMCGLIMAIIMKIQWLMILLKKLLQRTFLAIILSAFRIWHHARLATTVRVNLVLEHLIASRQLLSLVRHRWIELIINPL
jgi:hypothetical protein